MLRSTTQRTAIRRSLYQADRPLSPEEVREAAQHEAPNLGLATVYRTLKGLVAEGWLVPVELPSQPTRYEVAGKHHHHHFHCRACGQVFEVPGCPRDLSTLTPPGFRLEAHEVILYGRCPPCDGPMPSAPRKARASRGAR
ncbi:MAG: transcriptional repressor [Deltaproteobacteria bacterium]|nr:transcriptional repressor [Deltaproteobacteria bacterium]